MRDRPHAALPRAPTILIVLMGSLGDVVRGLPLASILRQHRPHARIAWLVDWRWREIAAAHPGIDRVLTFPRGRTPKAFAQLVAELRALRPDVALDLQRILKSGVASFVSRAPRRIGFAAAEAKEFNRLFNTESVARQPDTVPKGRRYLAFTERLGLPVPDRLEFGLRALADPSRVPRALRRAGADIVAIVMGASWPSKTWPAEHAGVLADIVRRETPCHVVLVGDRSQRAVAGRLADARAPDRLTDLTGQTSVTELGAVLALARAAVGPDSGPGHLAAALGTPHVTLFGPTDPVRTSPYGCEHLVVRSPVLCGPWCGRRCRRRAGRCMDAITPDMAWRVLGPLLA